MNESKKYDAVVIGSGPNGLAAAITLAQAGWKVLVLEAKETVGGGVRSAALTLPGFTHDTCSAVYPMAAASPFFRNLPLEKHGLEWIFPEVSLAHPFDDGTAACLYQSVEKTAATLGKDGYAYSKLIKPWVKEWENLFAEILSPLHFPKHPLLLASFGLSAILSAETLIERKFKEKWARGLMAGLAGHSFLPLSKTSTSAIGLVLGLAAHAKGWPIPKGGAGKISEAMASYFLSLGGEIKTNHPVENTKAIPPSKFVFFDLVPIQLMRLFGESLSASYQTSLKKFKYGPGVFKIDWALETEIPWTAKICRQASTVHLGNTFEEIAVSEKAIWTETNSEKPYVLLSQPSVFDPSRAPAGKHTAWAYCHVPRNSTFDMTERIENQVERFAPGFKKTVLKRAVITPQSLELYNSNFIGGDITGGISDLRQAFFRPLIKANPYETSVPNWYLCSASTPPGPGVHGMCGYYAAKTALKK